MKRTLVLSRMTQVLPESNLALINHGLGLALQQAQLAATLGEVPVGAVVLRHNGDVLSLAHNEKEARKDPTAHAEVLAIQRAAIAIGDWRLTGCILICTLEPCPMCLGAILHARFDELVYGALDHKWGACVSRVTLDEPGRFNHSLKKTYLSDTACSTILTDFFKQRRRF